MQSFVKKSLLVLFLAFVCLIIYVRAQTADLRERFQNFDQNKDGVIAGDEMKASPILPKLDLDGNQELTLSEAMRAVRKLRGAGHQESKAPTPSTATGDRRLFDFLDKNKDAVLSESELPQKGWMQRLDGDADGKVTFEEADAVVRRMKEAGETLPTVPGYKETEAKPTPAPSSSTELTEAPKILKGNEYGVGTWIPDLVLTDFQGEPKALSHYGLGKKALIIAFLGATCPISQKMGPELARLEKDAAEKGVGFLLVCPVALETKADIEAFLAKHHLTAPVIHDQKGTLSQQLTAQTTTECFLLDSSRTLIYRGAINDQYGLGYSKEKVTHAYLREALDALLRAEKPAICATTAPGCELDLKAAEKAASKTSVTYHREISRIMQANCIVCHRQGGAAPFSLEAYEDVIENAGMIRKQVERGVMPPWFAATPPEGGDSPWSNDCSLSSREKADLLTWLAGDRAKGDEKEAPLPIRYPKTWQLGEPDTLVQLPQPISIKAEGTMPYQFVTVRTDFPEDRWVQAYEILPTDPTVVHHVIVQVHEKGKKVRDQDEGREGYWAAYVPGNTYHEWPRDFGKKLPAGATVSFQIHYTPNGKATQDQLRLGLHFADREPRYIVHTASVAHHRLQIPPGAANHQEQKQQKVPQDMQVLAFMAHMHVRGKAFKFELVQPSGASEVLLDIPRYDFNWQLRYDYAKPRLLTKGSQFRITAMFDNSSANPANPDPTKLVRWGPQTQDEMMIGYIDYFTPGS